MTYCKYCDEPIGVLSCGGVIVPSSAPISRAFVCAECSERDSDWFHDTDMEDR